MPTAIEMPVNGERRSAEAPDTMQLVSFRLGQEEFGIEITKVQEIILMGEITRMPEVPVYIKGLICLRSSVVPILDLRIRFGLEEVPSTDETRIMVVNIKGKTVGLIVDAVSEVLRVTEDQMTPPPPAVSGLGREYLTGLVRLDERLLVTLDIDNLIPDNIVIDETIANEELSMAN